jgi:CHAD domain-containing protein
MTAKESVEGAAVAAVPGARLLLTRRARELFRVYPKALVGDVEAVHDLRVAARRLRMALVLLADEPDGRRARRARRMLHDLAAAAGRGRDLDVGIAILEASPASADQGHLRLRRSLSASRSRARVLTREALLDLDVARLRRDVRACAASTRVGREVVTERLATLRHREEETIDREISPKPQRPRPEALHRARRSARRLRYATEIVDLLDGTPSGATDRWRTMQNRLGEIQDRHVFRAWLELREHRATAQGDSTLAAACSRALARVKRDVARRVRGFIAADAVTTPSPPA